ncbi:DUF4336 domain-containing protein [Vibrio sp. WXL103]|uniref:DUF4336 domain-containing protein n=1 Tax=Vibrio sp. WXL103 TaxID=3450710 RepID=UPI003EC8AF7A
MEKFAQDIWIFEGPDVQFLGLPYSTRMTVVRLPSGELWVHSPIQLSTRLFEQVTRLGQVKYLIAPNHLHHLFLPEWVAACPDALVYGTDEVIKKRSDIAFSASLNATQSFTWNDSISQLLFSGSRLMEECVFFHQPSKTLIVTDLIENFSGENFTRWQRWLARVVGILAPNGQMPLDWRLSFRFNKPVARQHLIRIQSWQPEKIIMAHGEPIREEACGFLARSFRWLL